MPDAVNYVVVDHDSSNRTILGGPYLWDGEAEWTPPEDGVLMTESSALAGGWSYPPPPPPPSYPWVAVNPDTMGIVGGPWDWNGQGDPPSDGQLMSETDALAAGYTYP